jgi:hypothetical protein
MKKIPLSAERIALISGIATEYEKYEVDDWNSRFLSNILEEKQEPSGAGVELLERILRKGSPANWLDLKKVELCNEGILNFKRKNEYYFSNEIQILESFLSISLRQGKTLSVKQEALLEKLMKYSFDDVEFYKTADFQAFYSCILSYVKNSSYNSKLYRQGFFARVNKILSKVFILDGVISKPDHDFLVKSFKKKFEKFEEAKSTFGEIYRIKSMRNYPLNYRGVYYKNPDLTLIGNFALIVGFSKFIGDGYHTIVESMLCMEVIVDGVQDVIRFDDLEQLEAPIKKKRGKKKVC